MERKGNVLFNDAFNTFYLRLYGIRRMVKYHSDSERGNLLPPLHGLLFLISSRVAHTTTFVTPVMEHWLHFINIYNSSNKFNNNTRQLNSELMYVDSDNKVQ